MDKKVLFQKTFNPESARNYIEKKNLFMSRSVDVNYNLANRADKQAKKFQSTVYNLQSFQIEMNLDAAQSLVDEGNRERNAYSWLMVKTALDEAKQGWKYIEDMNWYYDHMFDLTTEMDYEKKMNLDMIRYFQQTRTELLRRNILPPFKFSCWQYTLIRLKELGYSLQDYIDWRKYHPEKGTRVNQEIN